MDREKILKLLKLFTSTEPTSRLYDPFDLYSFTYATNGIVAVRARGELSGKNAYMVPRLDPGILLGIFKRARIYCKKFQDLPKKEFRFTPDGGQCPECLGAGNIDFSNQHNSYREMCKTCSGEGVLDLSNFVHGFNHPRETLPLVGADVNAIYLNLLRELPGIQAQAQTAWINETTIGPVYFIWDEGDAVLMPLCERLEMDERKK